MHPKILFVDDDANLLDAIQRALRKQFSIERAVGGAEGLQKIADEGPFALVVADMQMPGMSGLEFLRAVRAKSPDTVRIMLTGNNDQKTAIDAVNDGHVFRFLTKPCPPPTLSPAIEAGLAQHQLIVAERELLENTLGGAVKVLTEVLAMADPATFERSTKLKEYVREFMAVYVHEVPWEVDLAASLCQIGRVTIPPAVLEKARDGFSLTAPEKSLLDQIPAIGARLLENIPRLEKVAAIVRYNQKRFDGSGFPAGASAGGDLPIGARILKVLGDLLDLEARNLARPAALQQMQERIGWYDLEVLSAVSRWSDVSLNAPQRPLADPELTRVDQIRTGQVLAQDLRTRDGLLIMAAGSALTPMLLAKLLNFATLGTIDPELLVYPLGEVVR